MKNIIQHSPRKAEVAEKAVARVDKVPQDGLAPLETHRVVEEITIRRKDSAEPTSIDKTTPPFHIRVESTFE